MATSTPPPDIWATATGDENGLPVIYRYRANRPHAVDAAAYPSAVRIIWSYDAAVRNGMPPHATNDRQVDLEDAIGPICAGDIGCLMLVFTGNGRKEWLFYVSDPESWVTRLNSLLEGHTHYPIDIENWPDETWSVWQEFVDSVSPPENTSLEPP